MSIKHFRDTIIIFCKWLKGAGFSIFGVIFAPAEIEDEQERYTQFLSHEFGHTLQYRHYGFWKYLIKVALPSLFHFILYKFGKISSEEYDELPWEKEATELGDSWGDFDD